MSIPTVLIVDDDLHVRFTMAHHLQKWHYTVLEADSGEQALAMLRATPVALILLDQMMPDCSGLEVFLRIKTLLPSPPPVIMMSAYSSIELAVAFLKAGGTDFIQKPSEMDVLEVKIRQAIAADEQQHRIRHELQKLSQAVEQSPATVMITDLDGRIEYINPKCARLTGYRSDEIVGKTPRIFESGKHSEAFYRTLWQTIRAGEEWHGEFCNKKKNGALYWESASISPIRNQAGEMTHWVKVAEDITERKQAEVRIKESEAAYRTLFEQNPFVVVLNDLSGAYVDVNHEFCVKSGYAHDEVIGKTAVELGIVTLEQHLALQSVFDASGGALDQYETDFHHADKKIEHVLISSKIIRLHDKPLVLSLIHDITERKESERLIQEAKRLADEANRAKSDFLTGISHELRTPLNGILGYTQILQQDYRLNDEQRRAVDVIHQSGEHLLLLINEILDLSKIEARRMELAPEQILLPKFLANVIEIVRVRAQQKDLTFHAELAENLPQGIVADEKRLRQILLNLLGNAIKFTLSGSITFSVATFDRSSCSQGSEAVGTRQNCCRIRFEIRDTGVGIQPEQLDKIFAPFHQVKDSRIRKEEGTGLGLSICQQLVRLMGGEISVVSILGEGSAFSFELEFPAVEAVRDHHTDAAGLSPFRIIGAARRILVVDDVASNRALLRDMLTPLGFLIEEAANGQEALEKTISSHPDAILMDLVMPVMDGMTAVRQIREHPDLTETVVIALSASVQNHTRELSLAAGCNDYLIKPIRMTMLFQKLQEYLHLEWQSVASSRAGASSFAHSMVYPPMDALGQLLRMAWQGDVIGVQDAIRLLVERDAALMPFVRTVEHLASNFLIEEMQDFLIQAVYDTYDAIIE